jgi:hypothetical protein
VTRPFDRASCPAASIERERDRMTEVLIGLGVTATVLAWGVVAWRTQAARGEKHRQAQKAQRAKFNGGIPRGEAEAAEATRPSRRFKPQFGRR